MLAIAAALIAGTQIRRLWPIGALFLLVLAALTAALTFLMKLDIGPVLGGPVHGFTVRQLLNVYLSNLLFYAVPFILSWCAARYFRKRRSLSDKAAE